MDNTNVYTKLRHIQWINWMIIVFSFKAFGALFKSDHMSRKIGYEKVVAIGYPKSCGSIIFTRTKFKRMVHHFRELKYYVIRSSLQEPIIILEYKLFKKKPKVTYDDRELFAFAAELSGFDVKIVNEDGLVYFELTSTF